MKVGLLETEKTDKGTKASVGLNVNWTKAGHEASGRDLERSADPSTSLSLSGLKNHNIWNPCTHRVMALPSEARDGAGGCFSPNQRDLPIGKKWRGAMLLILLGLSISVSLSRTPAKSWDKSWDGRLWSRMEACTSCLMWFSQYHPEKWLPRVLVDLVSQKPQFKESLSLQSETVPKSISILPTSKTADKH